MRNRPFKFSWSRLRSILCLPAFLWPLFAAKSYAAEVEPMGAQPYAAVRYEHQVKENPAQQIYVLRIDLSDPNVDVRVSQGGLDPDGMGEFQTTLQTPTVIAERERFDIAINGDFFAARQTKDVEGAQSGYVTGKWAKAIGPAVTDGYLWAPASESRAALIFDAQKHPRILSVKDVPPDAYQVVAGSHIIVHEGQISVDATSGFSRTRHPRSAVGFDRNGKTLVLVVVDGRRPNEATGMSLPELAELMKQLGCHEALNLDGGGSSELVLRHPQSGELQVLNRPSDGRERAVANVLGLSIRGTRRVPQMIAPTPSPAVSPANTAATTEQK